MKVTPFYDKHISLGAHMADFGGYNMPIHYTGVNDEHLTVRENAGIFDVSHMGEFIVSGPEALELIQYITSNDLSKIAEGKAQYTCMVNENGGIIDDLIVYCLRQNQKYMLVVNASNIDKDWDWITTHNTFNANTENISEQTCLLAIQGPKALKILQSLTDFDLNTLKFYSFIKSDFAGVKDVIISATGYTGSGGVEIYFQNKGKNAETIWDRIFDEGAPQGLKPVGLAARDTLRLEMGYCLYGNDIDDDTSPLEAGLGWIVQMNKGDFIGKSKIAKVKEDGIKKKLVGIGLLDRGIPRTGFKILSMTGKEIGYITSGTQSPSLKKPIALGYVSLPYSKTDSEILIRIRNKNIPAKVVKVPFQ